MLRWRTCLCSECVTLSFFICKTVASRATAAPMEISLDFCMIWNFQNTNYTLTLVKFILKHCEYIRSELKNVHTDAFMLQFIFTQWVCSMRSSYFHFLRIPNLLFGNGEPFIRYSYSTRSIFRETGNFFAWWMWAIFLCLSILFIHIEIFIGITERHWMHFNVTDSIIRGCSECAKGINKKKVEQCTNNTEWKGTREMECIHLLPVATLTENETTVACYVPSLQSTFSLMLMYLCVRTKADSRSLTGLILQRVMKEQTTILFSHPFPLLSSFSCVFFLIPFRCFTSLSSPFCSVFQLWTL